MDLGVYFSYNYDFLLWLTCHLDYLESFLKRTILVSHFKIVKIKSLEVEPGHFKTVLQLKVWCSPG